MCVCVFLNTLGLKLQNRQASYPPWLLFFVFLIESVLVALKSHCKLLKKKKPTQNNKSPQTFLLGHFPSPICLHFAKYLEEYNPWLSLLEKVQGNFCPALQPFDFGISFATGKYWGLQELFDWEHLFWFFLNTEKMILFFRNFFT